MAEQSLISSEQWLQLHGLKIKKLTLKQILAQIGFPQCEDYVTSLKRLVASRYADGLFPQFYTAEDGRLYNLTAKSELIYWFVDCLTQAVESYKQRMDWLTSGSRQIFGVILEQSITIVLDCSDILMEELNLCQDALVMILQEQVALLTKFNIIWVSEEPVKWQECAVVVTEHSIAAAICWVKKMTFQIMAVGEASCLDALLEAGRDETIEAIYYFVVGDVPEESQELLLQRILEIPYPVCTVSFNAKGEETVAFLKKLSTKTHSRFHAFAERTECLEFSAFSTEDVDSSMTWNSRKLKGRLPPGAGVREDVFLIWREMEEACSTLTQVRKLVDKSPQSDVSPAYYRSTSLESKENREDTWDSQKWLQKYGLKAQKLTFYDVLADCSFRHADGVVDIKGKPEDESVQTSADTNRKTVHAKYCSRFIHVPWKDGTLVHVNITKEKCKWYSERVHIALARIQRRIKWLQDGSQALFGKVSGDCIYVLIDTSHSMKSKLDLVKDKIIRLIQEQLRYKSKFNFVTFDGQAIAWREKLAEINEDNLEQAESWIRDIKVGSSTNTLNALKIAFADKETQAIYLLTDGRPDQPPEMVMDHVRLFQTIPIYAISFNYNDEAANEFLKELASLTGGEFRAYDFGCKDPVVQDVEDVQQDEDMSLLVQEMQQGYSDLEKMQELYSETLVMDWWYSREKQGDSKHQKEISSVVSSPEKCANSPSDADSKAVSPPKVFKGPRKVLDGKTQKKKVLHAERSILLMNKCLHDKLSEGLTENRSQVNDHRSQVNDHTSADMSSEKWLQTHGLVAKKLTIMDALTGTVVPRNATYVPILNKHVVSKVFNEVSPLAHMCSDTNKMVLINPQGVKLNIYKQNVEQAIKSYEKRLNKIVWRALSQEEKEKLDAIKPMQYLEHKAVLNKALERLNWPISLKELSMLENEILVGKMYIQQAMELQEAARKNCVSKALEEEQKLQGCPTKRVRSRRVDPLRGQKVIARCEENGFYFPGVVKKCVSPTHALVDFRYGETTIVPISFITPVGGAMPCPQLQVGDYVFAKIVTNKGFDFYVPAIVIALPDQSVPSEKFYTVLKCNNRREFCPRSALIKISQNKYALSCSQIKASPVEKDRAVGEAETSKSCPLWTVTEEDFGNLKQSRQETLRKKKKKPTKRSFLREMMSSDSDGSSHGTRSPESNPSTFPVPRVGDWEAP
ncbi:von Willebrand factor A domain-containing protein 3B [Peromyscus californicus insignis]|uniref:von Willebrand factor A domain-containing protein 3B n=1 Tax=Peromyscus californicus insignis TaxID=564181 RepID=UPI0022A6999B|nr:von Willebrand factor A domain-containing protein 3B [Peromyscus californicus insignis]